MGGKRERERDRDYEFITSKILKSISSLPSSSQGMGYVWTSDVTGSVKVWGATGGKMKVKKDISTDKMCTRCAFTVMLYVGISRYVWERGRMVGICYFFGEIL